MIVPIIGNVKYQITMDPTVWIFDDRKIILEDAFSPKEKQEKDAIEEAAKQWELAIAKPPVDKTLTRHAREDILKYSYVMPIHDFLNHAEIHEDAKDATLITTDGDISIAITELYNSYLLFALNGKPLKEDGPVHLIFKDGKNKDNPIKGIKKIKIN
jgi:hypothetical protein